ncbi:Zinc finger mym-type protein 3 [Plakobranchus ocellatus]|uniref:Zinc finger mym-type protein 3 n=1 Tax=Plakobranchus ocellatus TaxID=259542 RepID=A0AAV4CAX5_9GAST|nr:Zinc finger mym-type protein 3 [Plakobranchus ocellatus]
MESEEAIMENENNSNLESESINRDRDGGIMRDAATIPEDSPSASGINSSSPCQSERHTDELQQQMSGLQTNSEEQVCREIGDPAVADVVSVNRDPESMDHTTDTVESEVAIPHTSQGSSMPSEKSDTSVGVTSDHDEEFQNDSIAMLSDNSKADDRGDVAQFVCDEMTAESSSSRVDSLFAESEADINSRNVPDNSSSQYADSISKTLFKAPVAEEDEANELNNSSEAVDEDQRKDDSSEAQTVDSDVCADMKEKQANNFKIEQQNFSSETDDKESKNNIDDNEFNVADSDENEDDIDIIEDSTPQSGKETESQHMGKDFERGNDVQDFGVNDTEDQGEIEQHQTSMNETVEPSRLQESATSVDHSDVRTGEGGLSNQSNSQPQSVEMRSETETYCGTQDEEIISLNTPDKPDFGATPSETHQDLERPDNESTGVDQEKGKGDEDLPQTVEMSSQNESRNTQDVEMESSDIPDVESTTQSVSSLDVENAVKEMVGVEQCEGQNDKNNVDGTENIDSEVSMDTQDGFENDDEPTKRTQNEEKNTADILEHASDVPENPDVTGMENVPASKQSENANSLPKDVNVSQNETVSNIQPESLTKDSNISSVDDNGGTEQPVESESINRTENVEAGLDKIQGSEGDNGLDKDDASLISASENSSQTNQLDENTTAAANNEARSQQVSEVSENNTLSISDVNSTVPTPAVDPTEASDPPTTHTSDKAVENETPTNAGEHAPDERGDEMIEARNIKQEIISEEYAKATESTDNSQAEVLRNIKKETTDRNNGEMDKVIDDVVILDDDGESFPVKKEAVSLQFDMPSDSQLKISSVSGKEQISMAGDASSNKANEKGSAPKKSKSRSQTCIVCLKVCRCKYNIVRNGDIKHLCGDDCFKQFRKTPSAFLKNNKDGKTVESAKSADSHRPSQLLPPPASSRTSSDFKTCSVCQLMNSNPSQPFCNWKGLDFCGEACLGKFQANLSSYCSFCKAYIPLDNRSTFCLKIGNDMRPFCQQRCYTEFKKNLRLCAWCQKDLSSCPKAFSAMVGSLDKKIRQFCSQTCRQRLEAQIVNVEVVRSVTKGTSELNTLSSQSSALHKTSGVETAICSVCQKRLPVLHTIRFQGQVHRLCSDLCLSAFQYTNKIGMSKCDNCGTVCTAEEAQAHFVQYEGQVKRFCGDVCVNQFRRDKSKAVSCGWCGTKKMNFDMIERLDKENKAQMFCSLNCLSLYRVNLQAKSNQAVPCDQCRTVTPAQYHLTMSDASVRNFCSYQCVMTFQAQFTAKNIPAAQPLLPVQTKVLPHQAPVATPKEPAQPASKSRGRMSTRQASKQQSSFPVISNVVSLASTQDQANEKPPSTPPSSTPQQSTAEPAKPNTLSSGDGKHQIIIQAPPVKAMKNKALLCRPVTLTKATSCRPHSQTKECQTDKIPDKQVFVPVPVPIYIPMPTVMYSAPTPIPVPFPVPIPVPVFIPTTRKSISGIKKTISNIVERMPSDPLEAELLMMAEAVASDKRDSDSESDLDNEFGTGFEDEIEEPVPAVEKASSKKKDGQGEEDMIQMALRMAEEMSGPIEDLESSVEPVAINTERPSHLRTPPTQVFQTQTQTDEDYVPPGSRGRGRGVKRAARGRPPSGRPKRQRVERSYTEDDDSSSQTMTPQPVVSQQVMEPAADASFRLKFTYGVNAWRHWVVAKNAQIEDSKTNNSFRVRTFPTDILKCTTDELNYSLIFFIKEVRKPNGEEYSPDSIYYLCLGKAMPPKALMKDLKSQSFVE